MVCESLQDQDLVRSAGAPSLICRCQQALEQPGCRVKSAFPPIDPVLGFQPRVAQYNVDTMELFAMLLKELDAVPEGDGTVLDHSLVFAFTDQSFAKIHAVDGLPIFVAGSASGRMKSGFHVAGDSSPVSRVGLTIQKAMGVSLDVWGKGSMEIRQPYTDLLA